MKTQTNKPQLPPLTQGKTTKDNDNKEQIQTQDTNNRRLVRRKAGILNQARRRPHSG